MESKIIQEDNLSDEELVLLGQQNSPVAMTILFLRYKSLIELYCRNKYMMGTEYEDILQEAYVGFYKAVHDFKNEKNIPFKVFFGICVKRQIISAIKKYSRKKHVFLNNYISLQGRLTRDSEMTYIEVLPNHNCDCPEKSLILKQNKQEIFTYLELNLTKFELRALKLVLNGLSHDDAAEVMSVSNKGVQNAMYRIRKKIRKWKLNYPDLQ